MSEFRCSQGLLRLFSSAEAVVMIGDSKCWCSQYEVDKSSKLVAGTLRVWVFVPNCTVLLSRAPPNVDLSLQQTLYFDHYHVSLIIDREYLSLLIIVTCHHQCECIGPSSEPSKGVCT